MWQKVTALPRKDVVLPTNVTELSRYRHRDSADLLRELAADLEAGRVTGLIIQSRDHRGGETTHYTGIYKRDTAAAVAAGLRMSIALTAAQTGFKPLG
jgi:hypothetical protein